MITQEQLIRIGLPSGQAKIYLSLLEKGPQFLQEVSKSSGIKRTTLYAIIEKMVTKELVGIEIKRKRKKYFAVDPESFLSRMREQRFFLQALMPQLKTLFEKQGAGNRVQVYDTMGGLKKILEEINSLNPEKDEMLTIEGDIKQALKIGFDFWKELLAKKKKLGISSRTVVPSSEKDEFVIRDHKIKLRTSAFLQDFKIMLYLYADKSAIMIPADTLCIVIENKKINDALTALFEMIWRRSKPIN
ncbi:MAG: helix-turn-helix domain-containing protein [Patescibacteria group bacterium]|nr:helix-turn-helix domain-containing protein [Patescibacteria group bacterium]